MSTRLLLDTSSTALQHLLLIFFPCVFSKIGKKRQSVWAKLSAMERRKKKTGNPGTNFHRLAVEKMSPEYVGLPCALYVDAVYLTKHEKCMWIL